MTTEDFRILSAPGVGAVFRELRPLHDTQDPIDNPCSPMIKAKLYEACRGGARKLGGQVATSFASVGLHGEALAVPQPAAYTPPAPDTSAQMQALTAAIAAALAQKGTRKAKPSYKFDGVLQQGGDGADDEFDLLSEEVFDQLLRDHEVQIGDNIPLEEEPKRKQLSAAVALISQDKARSRFSQLRPLWGPS